MSFAVPNPFLIDSIKNFSCWRFRPEENELVLEYIDAGSVSGYKTHTTYSSSDEGTWNLRYFTDVVNNVYRLDIYKNDSLVSTLTSVSVTDVNTQSLDRWEFRYVANQTFGIFAIIDGMACEGIKYRSMTSVSCKPRAPFNRC